MRHNVLGRARRVTGVALRAAAVVGLVGSCMASSCFAPNGTGDTSGVVGATSPSIEVTVDGAHAGPYAAGSDAFASLVDTDDTAGQLASTMLTLHATGNGDTCDLTLQRFGNAIAPFGRAPYSLVVPTNNETADRTASLASQISVTAGGLTLQCGGDDCGALFVVNVLDAAHLEGYLTATMQNPSDGAQSSVVVTFYVPWKTYEP